MLIKHFKKYVLPSFICTSKLVTMFISCHLCWFSVKPIQLGSAIMKRRPGPFRHCASWTTQPVNQRAGLARWCSGLQSRAVSTHSTVVTPTQGISQWVACGFSPGNPESIPQTKDTRNRLIGNKLSRGANVFVFFPCEPAINCSV